MLVERNHPAEETILGPFEVEADPARVGAFAAAAGGAGAGVPAAFPIVWLAEPRVRTALGAAAGPNVLPVHESQSFDYARPILPGEKLRLTLVLRREASPDRLVAEAEVEDPAGARALSLRTVLRLFQIGGDAP